MSKLLVRLICLMLVLAVSFSAFAGCKSEETQNSSKSTASSESEDYNTSSEESNPSEEQPLEDEDLLEELPTEEEEVIYEELKVDNTNVINSNFRGISAVHQLYNYMPDVYNRTYSEKQIKTELETLKTMGLKNIRSFYGSSLSWDGEKGIHDFESEWMQAFYKNCKDMQKIGVDIGITMQWNLNGFFEETKSTTQGVSLLGNGYVVPGDLEATAKAFELFCEESVLAFKAHGINNIKYIFCFTECNNIFEDKNAGETILEYRQYDKLYPVFDRAIKAVDKGLKSSGLRKQYKIVGPCDNWRADDGSEEYSRLVKYTAENLADEVDIIGSHNGYARSSEYTNDAFYDLPIQKLTDPLERAKSVNKEFWIDEYNVAINQYSAIEVRESHNNPWKGVALGAMINSVMNMGVNNLFLWTFYDQQWPNNTSGGGVSEFDNGVQICGYLPTLLESRTPRPAWYALSLLTRYVGSGKVYASENAFGVYISAIKRDDGEWTVVVTNYNYLETPIQIKFEKSMGGKNFYRHIYWASSIEPVPGCEMIKADAVAKGVTDGFYDIIPGGSVAVYTTVTE